MAKEKVEGALTKKSARLAPRGGARDTDGVEDHTRLFDSPVRRRHITHHHFLRVV